MKYDGEIWREFRCRGCRKLICLEYHRDSGRLGFVCPRCGEFTRQDFKKLRKKSIADTMSEYKLVLIKGGEK